MINSLKKPFFGLRKRFLLPIIIVSILLLCIGLLLSYQYSSVYDDLLEQTEASEEKEMVFQNIENHLQAVFFRARGYYAFKNENELAKLQHEMIELERSLEHLQQLPLHNESAEFREEFIQFFDRYKNVILPESLDFVERGDYEGLHQYSISGASSDVNHFLSFMGQYLYDAQETREALHKKLLETAERQVWVLLFFTGFVLLVFVLTVWTMIRYISVPIEKLTEASEALADGEEIHLESVGRKDEIGILSTSFFNMAKSIQDKENQMQTQNKELLKNQKELRKHQEKLEHLNEINNSLTFTTTKIDLLDNINQELNRIYQLDKSILLFVDEPIYSSIGVTDAVIKRWMELDKIKAFPLLVEKQKPYIIEREVRPEEAGLLEDGGKSYDLYVPVFSSEKKLIAVLIANRVNRSYHQEEIDEIFAVMKNASFALERIVLYEKTESERQLNQDIIDHVNEGIQFVDKDGVLLQYNEVFCDYIKCNEQYLYAHSPFTSWIKAVNNYAILDSDYSNSESISAFFHKAINNNHHGIQQIRYKTKDDKVIDVYASPVFRAKERIGSIFVHRDITKQNEVDQMKSNLVSTVSHELRTPLSSVLGYAELLMTKELKEERRKKYAETIFKEANRLTNLINDFLDLQKMESGKQTYHKERVNITEIAEEVMDVYRVSNPNHQLQVVAEDAVEIYADRDKMSQMLMNFISNAIKFSPNGGTVELSIQEQNSNVILEIKDEGIGIPEREVPKLFHKFYRVDNSSMRLIGGTGLGLAICREIVGAHDGKIEVYSELGKGTTFVIHLPSFVEKGTVVPIKNSEMHVDKVIVVEDDSSLAMLLTEELNNNQFKVIHFFEPCEAMKELKKNSADAIVLDLMFEGSVDGWGFLKDLKEDEKLKYIPVFISSALDEVTEKSEKYGIKDYFTKPYPLDRLSDVIKERLRNQEKRGQISIPKMNEENQIE
ncbi:ATP-binding protein [Evansella sp. AB-rgal1]|uniref:ATP-binding protein n=1 Tax=Evansella sp. AB-rgal1 TaxID=3242696 RepID=UPI00359E5243